MDMRKAPMELKWRKIATWHATNMKKGKSNEAWSQTYAEHTHNLYPPGESQRQWHPCLPTPQ